MSKGSSKRTERARVVRRLEEFFELAGLWCPESGGLDDRAKSLGISDVSQWEGWMGAGVAWVLNNHEAVRAVLPVLEPEWAGACASVRLLLRDADAWVLADMSVEPQQPLKVSVTSPETGWVVDEVEDEGPEEDDERRAARRAMFDLLKQGGYDRVEVEYEGIRGVYTAEVMTFYRGDKAVDKGEVSEAVSDAVWDFVSECILTEESFTETCDGSARIYTASEYACFEQHAWTVDKFSDGEPGDDVPEEDAHPCPFMEELLQGDGFDFGDDEGGEGDGFDFGDDEGGEGGDFDDEGEEDDTETEHEAA